ncbi:KTSC domain-containing protein [Mesorhizobium sp. B2-5-4]|uniref:KTSC domain-containing protein n=1 Tax=unclassified Mesorhizobium TaxID=325217 RepID=UPI0011280A5F|nr:MULTISPECIES: KTSC domain-containing protein [unclassified Mesorhizobium]TPJ83306.1 KTSC domain-containing protein [Mesorhizobium sp. B2-5-13]TPK38307.1 KTSC domain-containing protein [Mesorhizobium sp. B2-5-4]TPK44446.1 KTSC domain-containing protein [Mesorhizobium sp. B2-5-5]
MERQSVSSSSLASVGCNPGSETLQVEFLATGKVYEYYNVPQFMYDRLLEASSIGQFFNAEIRNVFNAEIRNAYPCNPI